MRYGSIVLEKKEYVILKQLLALSDSEKASSRKQSITRLKNELESAIILDEAELPTDVIRFNTEVIVGTSDGWENSFTLVSPTENDFANKKVSVLSPMGLAIIGYAKGDVIDWDFPGGTKALEIKEVKQTQQVN
ncbi:GreA/GreB family elongation factor [Oceanihabitans sediminis]|uniref:Transcription elongation factor GreAB n=1 Tax=Oceanihabitans sediminis TaxID=1812012 RepID=A0A368P4Y7_9FLAO|nr:GreA/GreB family elongation factor [Oceanihabitans sediminis]MDX1278471.1 GreA/GreB family elongation factor [Oceanihabitans sediminis]MDX1773547.1 GreA/GreB family elongation factor [Oceanihabitans sediminis]RBP32986.1 regulator of nucleoside diphosphate kinase [Oceanihabitans sediminis]RCU57496.1 transcription elongation factor GreAB [Oceanihabitans sediminis]